VISKPEYELLCIFQSLSPYDRAKLIGAYDGGMDEGVGTGRVDDQFVVLGIIAQQRQMVATLLTT